MKKTKQSKKEIIISTDHAGLPLKKHVEKSLLDLKIPYTDYSTENTKTDDYPDFAKELSEEIIRQKNKHPFGILICGTGIGMSIAANKIKGIRAALCHTKKEAQLARKHNDANILVLPGPYSSTKLTQIKTKEIIKAFYNTKASNETKHKRRILKLKKLEK